MGGGVVAGDGGRERRGWQESVKREEEEEVMLVGLGLGLKVVLGLMGLR